MRNWQVRQILREKQEDEREPLDQGISQLYSLCSLTSTTSENVLTRGETPRNSSLRMKRGFQVAFIEQQHARQTNREKERESVFTEDEKLVDSPEERESE